MGLDPFTRLALELSDRRTLLAGVVLLLVFTASALLPLASPSLVESGPLGDEARKQLDQIKRAGEGGGLLGLPKTIFLNNLRVSLLLAATYFTIIVPLAVIALNGLVIGFLPLTGIMEELASTLGRPLVGRGAALVYYAGLVPHGMLELATILLVASLMGQGLEGGPRGVAGRIARRVLMAAVNLGVAALVETIVTPLAILIVVTILALA